MNNFWSWRGNSGSFLNVIGNPWLLIVAKTLVLDMDETLIKASLSLKQVPNYDKIITIMKGTLEVQVYVKTRPYLKEVLRVLRENFELILFTSGSWAYATAILNEVIEENDDFFDYVITREHCLLDRANSITVKDLQILLGNRHIKDIIIVDNCAKCYIKQIENGIPIPAFEGHPTDKYLVLLKNYLVNKLQFCSDVREIIKIDFRINEL